MSTDTKTEPLKAYKGFNKDLTCRGFQYVEGETYEESAARLCSKGFHACLAPIDVFGYYAPGTSVYHEVTLEGVDPKRESDSKVAGRKISIGLPRIGCGIGGLDWESQVKPLLEEIAATTEVRLVVVTPEGQA